MYCLAVLSDPNRNPYDLLPRDEDGGNADAERHEGPNHGRPNGRADPQRGSASYNGAGGVLVHF